MRHVDWSFGSNHAPESIAMTRAIIAPQNPNIGVVTLRAWANSWGTTKDSIVVKISTSGSAGSNAFPPSPFFSCLEAFGIENFREVKECNIMSVDFFFYFLVFF